MTLKNIKIVPNQVPFFIIVFITLFCLGPFTGKAFNIDEPLFIWVARQIQLHPLDYYGFQINWYGWEMSAAEIIKNPPLASYYIALAAAIGGWSELYLHCAFLLPALAAVTGTYLLSREFTATPLTATIIGMISPVFLLSSGTVMCDTMMLAAYVWAVALWVRGMRLNSSLNMLSASLLIAFCCLTKYFGMSLIPLLFLYSVFSKQENKLKILFLMVPIIILWWYQLSSKSQYGRGLLMDAANYAISNNQYNWHNILSKLITGLSFTGGCLIPTLFFAPYLWGRRTLLVITPLIPLLAIVLFQLDLPSSPKGASWSYFLQLALFCVGGIHLGALAGRDILKRKNPESLMLFVWLAGTFVFATFVNWTVNGRSILPMVPVAGILVMRALGDREHHLCEDMKLLGSWRIAVPLVFSWLISMSVMWADYSLAGTSRKAAEVIARNYGKLPLPLLFQGHWGFQYYMEMNGAVAMDINKEPTLAGRIIVTPGNNDNVTAKGALLGELHFAPAKFATVLNVPLGANFYSSDWSALPFAFGMVPDEKYYIAILE